MIPLEFRDAQDKEDPNHGRHLRFLYDLLRERLDQASVNITHVKMPSYEDHVLFVEGQSGYEAHFVIVNEGDPTQMFATLYVTDRCEIGITVARSHQDKGYGRWILETFLSEFPGTYYANINPENFKSQKLFGSLGFKPLQYTYKLEGKTDVAAD